MSDRALVVLDHVSRETLDAHLAPRGLPLAQPVALQYVPRTTPVGHATISTGRPPAVHGVQGRAWRQLAAPVPLPRRIDDVVTLTRPVAPDPFAWFGTASLAAQLRRTDGTNGIVAVAAKDFIPYLFGAWDCDVIVYPFDVVPQPIAGWRGVGLAIVFVALTDAGDRALSAAWPRIATLLARMAAPHAGSSMLAPAPTRWAARPYIHWATWVLPPSWGGALGSVAARWRAVLAAHADEIDDIYAEIAVAIAPHLPSPRALLLSCFSTDAHGHAVGPAHPRYHQAVEHGIDRALRLAGAGYLVGVTSDHGGRDTPAAATYDADAATVDGTPLPDAAVHFKDGDHVVGYRSSAPHTEFLVSTPGGLVPFHVPGAVQDRSYAPGQRPAWKVVGDRATHVMARPRSGGPARGGGGDHGICAEGGALCDVDDEVPAWSPNARSGYVPGTLDDIARWFRSLT